VCDVPVITTDIFPTVCELAGLAPSGRAIDGRSLVPLLRNESGIGDRALFWHFPHYNYNTGPFGTVRQGDFKLIEFYESDLVELYDLSKDIGESRNLADTLPAQTADLRSRLADWRRAVGAQMPVRNPEYEERSVLENKARPNGQ
jgi:arylsulfatase A-like enzyme